MAYNTRSKAPLALADAVKGHQAKASYCLGGSIPISSTPTTYGDTAGQITSPPIVLCFDGKGTEDNKKITFPITDNDADVNKVLAPLLQACAPATFGLDGKNVLDTTYRNAGKMDKELFSTNFHPVDFGVIDAISQTLLPGMGNIMNGKKEGNKRYERDERDELWSIVAELYKLNIYSGPSGKFNKHVDTPRGATQFGSLVVCLPFPHAGGELKVSHTGDESVFDWSSKNPNEISWAAFYSDCEHEVLKVKSGHRITLTYNLYISVRVGRILTTYSTADPKNFPLYQEAKEMLENSTMLTKGRVLGFYCQHQYAHTRDVTNYLMPYALKGIDATLFAVFQSLGARVSVRPILDSNWLDDSRYDSDEDDANTKFIGTAFHGIQEIGNGCEDEDPVPLFEESWPHNRFSNICWLNDPIRDNWDISVVGLTYGNEATLTYSYSHAVILIESAHEKH